MKWLFLALGACIFFASIQAYRELGSNLFGGMGSFAAIVVFLMVQGFELRPILMTNGIMDVFAEAKKLAAGKPANIPGCDPEELAEATSWATLGYAIDFTAGLIVWPIVTRWDLLRIGAITFSDIQWINVFQIIACVFLLQKCIQQYLRRGGKLPFTGGKKANA